METTYSMKDILKYRKAVYLAARMTGDENSNLIIFCKEPLPSPLEHLGVRSFSDLAPYFKPYLNGLTIERMEEIYQDFLKRVYRRSKEKIRFKPCTFTGKAIPASPDREL